MFRNRQKESFWLPKKLLPAHYFVGSIALMVLASLVAGIYETIVIAMQRA